MKARDTDKGHGSPSPYMLDALPVLLAKPATSSQPADANANTFTLVDNLDMTETFKMNVLMPYLTRVYECLTFRSRCHQQGVPAYAFVEVYTEYIVVLGASWTD